MVKFIVAAATLSALALVVGAAPCHHRASGSSEPAQSQDSGTFSRYSEFG